MADDTDGRHVYLQAFVLAIAFSNNQLFILNWYCRFVMLSEICFKHCSKSLVFSPGKNESNNHELKNE